jgi:alpha-L-rhamnosidase
MLLNFGVENSFREWLRCIRRAQRDDGSLPAIVPSASRTYSVEAGRTFGGPAWDCALIWLPYTVYLYRGDKTILRENAHAILRYLGYLSTKIRDDGLVDFGLGDWCPAGRKHDDYESPTRFTDTVTSIDMCEKAAYIFGELGLPEHEAFARSLYKRLRACAREELIDFSTMTAEGNCQTSQAMAIKYNLFEPGENAQAVRVLLRLIEQAGGHFTGVGILGGRVLFHVLAEAGHVDLALNIIARPDFPSYGWWVAQGATSLWEQFSTGEPASFNHHFWGDISHFFIRHLAGICYNPNRRGKELDICPKFAASLDFAEGWHDAPEGEIHVRWQRGDRCIRLDTTVPEGLTSVIRLPPGYVFEDGAAVKPLKAGTGTAHIPCAAKATAAAPGNAAS